MRSLSPVLLFAALAVLSAGCLVSETSSIVVEPEPPRPVYVVTPGYVYTYPDGGCWADGIWYPNCRWVTGPYYGYYVYTGGVYVHRPGITWGYRHGYPPPWHHRHHYSPPSRRHVPPARHAPPRHF